GHVSEYMGEVPRWLVLVEDQRQTQPIGHLKCILPNFGSPYALRTERSFLYGMSTQCAVSVRLRALVTSIQRLPALALLIALVVASSCAPQSVPPASTAPATPTASPTVARPSPTATATPSASPSPTVAPSATL